LQGGALATPPPVASALKAKFKFAERRRKKRMKKNAKILKNYLRNYAFYCINTNKISII